MFIFFSVVHFALLLEVCFIVTLNLAVLTFFHCPFCCFFFYTILIYSSSFSDFVNSWLAICRTVGERRPSWLQPSKTSICWSTWWLQCPTRWGSRQRVIGKVLEQTSLRFCQTARKCGTWSPLDWTHKSFSQSATPCIPFRCLQTRSGKALVSLSYPKRVLHRLRTSTLAGNEDETDLTKATTSRALDCMEVLGYRTASGQHLIPEINYTRVRMSQASSERWRLKC